MSQINRTGTFRFQPIDAGIATTKNGYPQWVAQLKATEYYDVETEQWIDWSEYDENEIVCYMVLFDSNNKPTLNITQLQKALGWSGTSFEELEYEHIADVIFQGRVEEHTYEGTTSLRVNWVDAYDAEPGRTLQKLDVNEVKKLNAKFATQLRELSGGTKPQSVPATKTSKEEVKAAKKEKLAEQAARSKTAEDKVSQPKSRPTPPRLPPKKKAISEEQEVIEKGQAWIDCCKMRSDSVSDKELENTWHDVVDSLGGEDAVEENKLWKSVRDKVISQIDVKPEQE